MYQVRLLSPSRDLIAVIETVNTPSYKDRLMEITEIQLQLPNDAPGISFAKTPNFVQILQKTGGVFRTKITGRIYKTNQSLDSLSITALSEAVQLTDALIPMSFTRALANLDLADLARELRWDREVLRIKDQTEWENSIAGAGLDTTTDPGTVLLAKTGTQYNQAGSLTLEFDSADVEEFSSWERLRFIGDNDQIVSVKVRYSEDSGVTWTDYVRPPDAAGYGVLINSSASTLQIQFLLETNDTTSLDLNDQPAGFTPALSAAEVICKTREVVTVGTIAGSTSEITNIKADGGNALKVLKEACVQAGYEFQILDGALSISQSFGADRRDDFVFRAGTNIQVERIRADDSEFFNEVRAYGSGDGLNRLHVTLRDAASITATGATVSRVMEFDSSSLADLTSQAQAALDYALDPISTYKIQLTVSNDEEPLFNVGDTVKVVDPVLSYLVSGRINEEQRTTKGIINLTVGSLQKTLAERIRDKIKEEEKSDQVAAPVGFRAAKGSPGIFIFLNPFTAAGVAGAEVHGSTTSGFAAGSETLLARGTATRYHLTDLTVDTRYYFKARTFNDAGQYSDFTAEVSATAGGIEGDTITGSIGANVDIDGIAAGLVRQALGAIWSNDFELNEIGDWTDKVGSSVQANTSEAFLGAYAGLFTSVNTAPTLLGSTEEVSAAIGKDIWQKWGDKYILISFYAKQPTVDPASEFAMAYVTADGNSGWETFTPTTSWARYAFKWKLPARTADGTDYLAVWGDTAGNGDKVLIDGLSVALAAGGNVATVDLITVDELAANAVTADKIAANTITAAQIAAGTITANEILANTITAAQIAAATITATQIAADTLTANEIAAATITALEIAANTITASQIAANTITASEIAANTITADQIAANTLTADEIAANAITAAKILAGSITTEKLTTGSLEITNSSRTAAQVVIQDDADVDQVVLGNIDGLAGVPASVEYGLWGNLGTSAIIRGAFSPEYIGVLSIQLSNSALSADTTEYLTADSLAATVDIELPAGSELYFTVTPIQTGAPASDIAKDLQSFFVLPEWSDDGGTTWTTASGLKVLAADVTGSVDRLRLTLAARLRAHAAISAGFFNTSFSLAVFKKH